MGNFDNFKNLKDINIIYETPYGFINKEQMDEYNIDFLKRHFSLIIDTNKNFLIQNTDKYDRIIYVLSMLNHKVQIIDSLSQLLNFEKEENAITFIYYKSFKHEIYKSKELKNKIIHILNNYKNIYFIIDNIGYPLPRQINKLLLYKKLW